MLIASVTKGYFHARPIFDRKVHRNFRSMQLQQQQQQPSAMSVVNNYTAKQIGPLCLLACDVTWAPSQSLLWTMRNCLPPYLEIVIHLLAACLEWSHHQWPVTPGLGSWLPQTSDDGDTRGGLFWHWGIGHMRQQLLRTRIWGPPLLQTRLWVPSVRFTKPPLEYFYIRYLVTWPGYAISSGGSSQKTE